MPNYWILDVLEDLRNFSDANDLPELSKVLDQAQGVARHELIAHKTPGVSLIHASFSGDTDREYPLRRHS